MAGRPPEPDDEREPTPDADDIDVRFADIAANLGELTVPPAERPDDASADPGRDHGRAEVVGGPRDYTLGPEVALGDDADGGFSPPEPPPLGGGEPLLRLGWAGVVGPVVVVLLYLVAWRGMPLGVLGAAGAVFVVSVGVLIWRLPRQRDPDDHDDGAVV